MIWTAVAALLALGLGWLFWGRALNGARAEAANWRSENDRHIAKVAEAAVAQRGYEVELTALRGTADRLTATEAERAALAVKIGAIEAQAAERDRQFEARRAEIETQFALVTARALASAQAQFLASAEKRFAEQKQLSEAGMQALLAPVAETLVRYEAGLKTIEAARNEAYGGLKEQLLAVTTGQQRVSDEASKLVSALRSSGKTSGSWGEQQLRNTLEMAGLRETIDFTLQASVAGEDGSKRPDAVINLPGGRQLIIDSKCSLNDYLGAGEAESEDARRAAYRRHALAVRTHAKGLGDKAYWKEFGASADFVVMFLPGENFLSAALEHDLPLLGWAFDQRILLAGPINLLAIAKTVALVWRQETLAEKAREIGTLGAQLHASIAVMAEHLAGVGKNLNQAVNGYNNLVGSLERNVLPKARRFTELGIEEGKKPVPILAQVETVAGLARAQELLAAPSND